jgi:hypothetical protein
MPGFFMVDQVTTLKRRLFGVVLKRVYWWGQKLRAVAIDKELSRSASVGV